MKVSFGTYWQSYGRQTIEIPDDTEDIAEYLKDNWDDIPLPTGEYIACSDKLDEESIVIIK